MQKKPLKIKQEENEKPEGEIFDFNKPDFSFIPKGRHLWRQQGYYLICHSCNLHHAVFIGMDKIMVGETSEGEPILHKR